jgi:hypothetical protein
VCELGDRSGFGNVVALALSPGTPARAAPAINLSIRLLDT